MFASYTPKVRFKRTWMPQMSHGFNIIRVNSYIVQKNVCTHPVSAKQYVLVWIRTLMLRARMCSTSLRKAMAKSSAGVRPPRRRLSAKNPVLPADRLNGQLCHELVFDSKKKQGRCLYCRYKYLCAKIKFPEDKSRWGVIGRPKRKCLGCDYTCVVCVLMTIMNDS